VRKCDEIVIKVYQFTSYIPVDFCLVKYKFFFRVISGLLIEQLSLGIKLFNDLRNYRFV